MVRRTAAEQGEPAGRVVYLGLGSNLGNRADMLRRALEQLATLVSVTGVSDVYESEPWGFTAQPHFLNMVVQGRTRLAPVELLHALKDIERRLGRTETVRMGPRVIDIDVLIYGDIAIEQDELTIPHPGLEQRAFVLVPLLEIDADLVHPVSGRPLRARLEPLRDAAAKLTRLGPLGDIGPDDVTG